MWYFFIYGLLAIWVLYDARKRKNNMFGWAIPTLILGPIFLPIYLAKRNLKEGEVREGGTGWNVLKNFALLWTLTMVIGGISGLMGAGTTIDQSQTAAEEAGAIIGTGLGMGLIFLLWFIPMIAAIIIGFFLKKSSVVEEGPTGKLVKEMEEPKLE